MHMPHIPHSHVLLLTPRRPQIFFIASSNAYTLTYLLFAPLGWWLYALLATATGYFRI